MAEVASESWWIKIGVLYDKSGFKAAIGGMADLKSAAWQLADTFKKVVDSGSDLYNTSKYLNVSTGQLQTWERAFRLIGGSADEARADIENLNYAYDELRLGMGGQKAEIAARLHLRPEDLLTFDTAMKALNRSFNTYFQGDMGLFAPLAKQLGLSKSAILMVTQSVGEYDKRIKRASNIPLIPEHQLAAARKLQEQFEKMSITWDNFKASVISASFPALSKLMQDIERVMNNPEVQKNLKEFFVTLEQEFNKLANDKTVADFIENLAIVVKGAGYAIKGIDYTIGTAARGYGGLATEVGTLVGEAESNKGIDWKNRIAPLIPMLDYMNPVSAALSGGKMLYGNLTQNITINGAQNPNATGAAVVDAAKNQRAVQVSSTYVSY